eukprot:TRINITY_DN1821_c0_g2_i2.p1 TRINITY_DN1821_c0_g2~~TRINITY_DN1821_c0_g2_i2.p1  ORF type:complete len:1068 (-),score=266.80 TRINITY_DN1821_c0_g2_i2:29-3232(-)
MAKLASVASAPTLPMADGANDGANVGVGVGAGIDCATSIGNCRGRSGSPASRRKAIRGIARGLRDSSVASDISLNASSVAHLMSPGGHGGYGASTAATTPSYPQPEQLLVAVRVALQSQLNPILDRQERTLGQMQARSEADARRVDRLERKMAAVADEAGGAGREKLAEINGVVGGLHEEVKALTQRLEGLDERLWARTSGSEAAKQRSKELEHQVSTLEHAMRIASSSAEESQRKNVARLRKSEQTCEDLLRRVAAAEEELRVQHTQLRGRGHRENSALESRVAMLEQHQEHVGNATRSLQAHVDRMEGNFRAGAGVSAARRGSGSAAVDTSDTEDGGAVAAAAARVVEQSLTALERRLSKQLQDQSSLIATLRVKVDGQAQRTATLSERLETAHEPALDAMRAELSQARTQDWRRLEGELAKLSDSLRTAAEERAAEESDAASAHRESLRQGHSELALQLQALRDQIESDASTLQMRLGAPGSSEAGQSDSVGIGDGELRQRLRRLERHAFAADGNGAGANVAAGDASAERCNGYGCGSRAGYDVGSEVLADQLSELEQRTSEWESVAQELHQRISEVQGRVEQLAGDDHQLWNAMASVEARVDAIAVKARPAPELTLQPGDAATALGRHIQNSSSTSGSDDGPGWEDADGRGVAANAACARQQELDAITERLRFADELTARTGGLERRLAVLATAVGGGGSSRSDVTACAHGVGEAAGNAGAADGQDCTAITRAVVAASSAARALAGELSEVQARLIDARFGLQTDGAVGLEGCSSGSEDDGRDGAGGASAPREDELLALAERVDSLERDLTDLQMEATSGGFCEQLATPSADDEEPRQGHGRGRGRSDDGSALHGRSTRALEEDHDGSPRSLAAYSSEARDRPDAEMSDVNDMTALAAHLGKLEDVFRFFAGKVYDLTGDDGDDAMVANVQGYVDSFQADVARNWEALSEQGHALADHQAMVGGLSEEVQRLGQDMDRVRKHHGSELKSLARSVRALQERDINTLRCNVNQTMQDLNVLHGAVGEADRRLGILEKATLAIKRDLRSSSGNAASGDSGARLGGD